MMLSQPGATGSILNTSRPYAAVATDRKDTSEDPSGQQIVAFTLFTLERDAAAPHDVFSYAGMAQSQTIATTLQDWSERIEIARITFARMGRLTFAATLEQAVARTKACCKQKPAGMDPGRFLQAEYQWPPSTSVCTGSISAWMRRIAAWTSPTASTPCR